ncbi:MAG: hypothetical protein AB4063_15405 [Crocosphaera sp.]
MDKYSIKDLQQKYGLKTRQSVYDWLKGVSAEVHKEGNRSFVTAEDVEKLDQLKEHLDRGGSIKSFTPAVTPTVYPEPDSTELPTDLVQPSTDSVNSELDKAPSEYVQLELFERLVDKVAKKITPTNPISHWEKLDLAADKGYILTTSEVRQLVGTKPKGKEWIRGAFQFIRAGKIGNQAGWKVSRIEE